VLNRGMRAWPALGLAMSAALAAQTKLFGVLVALFATGILLVGIRRTPGMRLPGVAGLAVIAASSWTYVRNLVVFGHIYPTRAPQGSPPTGVDFEFSLIRFLRELWLNTTESFWGRFGWLQLQILYPWVAALSVAVVACVLVSFFRPGVPGVRPLLIPVLLVVPTYVATALIAHLETGLFPAEQGRYLFPVLGSLTVAVVSTLWIYVGKLALLGLGVIAAFNWVISMRKIYQAYWAGENLSRFESLAAWSPIGSWSVLVIVTASLMLVGVLVAVSVVGAREGLAVSRATH
jgi:hypothetical protein